MEVALFILNTVVKQKSKNKDLGNQCKSKRLHVLFYHSGDYVDMILKFPQYRHLKLNKINMSSNSTRS